MSSSMLVSQGMDSLTGSMSLMSSKSGVRKRFVSSSDSAKAYIRMKDAFA